MVRVGKKKGGGGNRNAKKQYEPINSDSENEHYNDTFDANDPFGDDEIEKFHNDRDKILLKGHTSRNNKYAADKESSDEDQEVLAFDDSDSEGSEEYDEDADGDLENNDDDEKLISGSWGTKKSAYYSGNRIKNDEDAELEEEEARLLQAKMLKELDSNDFGLDAFQTPSIVDKKSSKLMKTSDELVTQRLAETHFSEKALDEESVQKVMKNLSKLSKKEKLDFLKQESPELFELVRDFKEKIEILEDKLLPIYMLVKQGNGFQTSMASEYIVNKTRLYLMYCTHLSFYFVLKAKRVTIENHPIVKNILQYRNLCKQIEKIDTKLESELELIQTSIDAGKPLSFRKKEINGQRKSKKSVKFRDALMNKSNKQDSLAFDDGEEGEEKMEFSKADENAEVVKRAINKEIEKNKGLTPKRPKSYRNPRVRNRLKARKAHIKHKSIVPKVRSQDKRYAGEATGIRTGIVRAVKIK